MRTWNVRILNSLALLILAMMSISTSALAQTASTYATADAPSGSGFWNMDVRATVDENSAINTVSYDIQASRVNSTWDASNLTYGSWSNGISWDYGTDQVSADSGSSITSYSSVYMSQVVVPGDVDAMIVRLNPFSGTSKVCWPPRFNPHVATSPCSTLKFLVKVPIGWHLVPGSVALDSPVDAAGNVVPWLSPPTYMPLKGDIINPSLLTMTFTFTPNPVWTVYSFPVYQAVFVLAPDSAMLRKK